MKRHTCTVGALAGVLFASSLALAQAQEPPAPSPATAEAKPQGLAVGLRSGYALPMGQVGGVAIGGAMAKASDLKDGVTGMVPVWVDAGYRLNPNMYVGASFQYGFAFVNTEKEPCDGCSAKYMAFGANFLYHILPEAKFDPWAGVGVGYEILSMSLGDKAGDMSFSGLQLPTCRSAPTTPCPRP
jgi:hypothetical protein